jgi:hypothetical protein
MYMGRVIVVEIIIQELPRGSTPPTSLGNSASFP